jgi:hypothetical protein
MNPNYLLRDELLYELAIRGINIEGDVLLLRKLMGLVLSEDVHIVPEMVAGLDVSEQLDLIGPKVAEMEGLLCDTGPGHGSVTACLRTRGLHLEDRLHFITDKEQAISSAALEEVRDLRKRVDQLLTEMGQMGPATGPPVTPLDEVPPVQRILSGGSVVPGNIPASETVVGQATSLDPGNGNVGDAAALRFTGCLFQRLPHSSEPLLKSLPVVNGLEVENLLDVLAIILKIRRLGQMLDSQLFEVLYAFCRKPLAERLLSAIAENMKFERFHELVLEYFLPRQIYQKLRQERFARVQDEKETFAQYVNQIKEAASV